MKQKTIKFVCLAIFFLFAFYNPEVDGQVSKLATIKTANLYLDNLSKQLAEILRNDNARSFLNIEIKSARTRENILDLSTILAKMRRQAALKALAQPFKGMSTIISNYVRRVSKIGIKGRYAALNVYFPVKDHLRKWDADDTMYVAYAPLGDERNVTEIIAYSVKTGQIEKLDPIAPPTIPTLVIAPEEHETLEPGYPIMELPDRKSEDINSPARSTDNNSYIGIPQLCLIHDNEPWFKGDPEVYLLAGRSHMTSPIEDKIWLNKVNHEHTWYWYGDPGMLYFYFDSNYSTMTYFHFWESDGGSSVTISAGVDYKGVKVGLSFTVKDDDDDMGKRYIDSNQLSFNGFQEFSTGDVKFDVDKDH